MLWLLVMVAPELRVTSPPVSKVTLSTKLLAPPTVILPASDAPSTIELKPFLKYDVPVNQDAGSCKVPEPEPTPIVAPVV